MERSPFVIGEVLVSIYSPLLIFHPTNFSLLSSTQAGRTIVLKSLSELPPEAAHEKREFEREKIASLLISPIFALNSPRVVGFLGVDSLTPRCVRESGEGERDRMINR